MTKNGAPMPGSPCGRRCPARHGPAQGGAQHSPHSTPTSTGRNTVRLIATLMGRSPSKQILVKRGVSSPDMLLPRPPISPNFELPPRNVHLHPAGLRAAPERTPRTDKASGIEFVCNLKIGGVLRSTAPPGIGVRQLTCATPSPAGPCAPSVGPSGPWLLRILAGSTTGLQRWVRHPRDPPLVTRHGVHAGFGAGLRPSARLPSRERGPTPCSALGP